MKPLTFFLFTLFICNQSFAQNGYFKKTNTNHTFIDEILEENGKALDNDWDFYWKKLLEPGEFKDKLPDAKISLVDWTIFKDKNNKHFSSLGYATYRKVITLKKDNENIAMYVPRIIGAYKLWINGKLVKQLGKVGTTASETLHRRFTQIIPLSNKENKYEIVIQVANFYNKKGGITEPIYIGNSDKIYHKKNIQHTTDMIFIGSLGFTGVLFLLFFFFFWNKDKAILYFSIVCIAMAYHTMNDRYAPLALLFDDLSWVFITKLEYLASHLVGIFGSLFMVNVIPKYVSKYYKKIIVSSILICSLLVVSLPAPYFTYLIHPFLIIMLLNLSYGLFTIIKAIKNKVSSSVLLLVSILSAIVIFSLHVIFFFYDNQMALIYVKYGYTIVFIFISLLLMQRFSKLFFELEKSKNIVVSQKLELANINVNLNDTINQLENSNAELDDFNHIVSHDLKSPLISVQSLTKMIEKDLDKSSNERTKKHLTYLKDAVKKMNDSINGLLEYSKATRENKTVEKFKINALLETITDYERNNSKTVIQLPKNNMVIFANKIELEHVFQNLISNSIKYNDKKKSIIKIFAEETSGFYTFTVSDNGPGIDEKYHKKIFKIFNKLEENKKDNSTGIGLAIVKNLVSKNNGKITVKSKLGEGLSISFTWKKHN